MYGGKQGILAAVVTLHSKIYTHMNGADSIYNIITIFTLSLD